MKKLIRLSLFLFGGLLGSLGLITAFGDNEKPASFPRIGICQIVEHPALDATYQGIIDELKALGYVNKQNIAIDFQSAQGSPLIASQIAQRFAGQEAEIMVGIGTTAAQALVKPAQSIESKVVFSSVTDPLQAGLVENLKAPAKNVTGVSNFVPIDPQFELFKQIQPKLKRLGVVYNPGEANSVSLLIKIEEAAGRTGLEIVPVTAVESSEVNTAVKSLVGKVDAIFVSNDNTALSAFDSIILVAREAKIPVYVSDTDMVKKGAVAALGPNQYQLGRQTGKMIVKILQGTYVNDLPVEFPADMEFYFNATSADKLGLYVDLALLENAKKVF